MGKYEAGMEYLAQWIMVGAKGPSPERPCLLIACHQLRLAELRIRYEPGPFFWDVGMMAGMVTEDASVTTHMAPRDLIMIEARTWQEALDELMRQWSPERGRFVPQEITMGPGELEAGDG